MRMLKFLWRFQANAIKHLRFVFFWTFTRHLMSPIIQEFKHLMLFILLSLQDYCKEIINQIIYFSMVYELRRQQRTTKKGLILLWVYQIFMKMLFILFRVDYKELLLIIIMNQQIKVKRPVKLSQNTTDVYLPAKNRNRYSHHQVQQHSTNNNNFNSINVSINQNNPHRLQNDTVRSFQKKSIENHLQNQTINVSVSNSINNTNNPYNQTICQPQRHYYKRNTQNIRRQLNKRYQQDELVLQHRNSSSKSPYLRVNLSLLQKQSIPGRSSSLNRSNNKIRSGSLTKQVAPQLYKQPRSSLSHHYQNELIVDHKRRSSVIGQDKQKDRNYILQEAKKLFHKSDYVQAIQLLKKFTRIYQSSSQGKYYLGMSYINRNDYNLGVKQLLQVLNLDPTFKKSIYLVLALAYKKQNKFEDAIKILGKGIQHFSDFHDLFLYRGKIHLKLEMYREAIKDFQKSIKLNSLKGYSYVGKGIAQKKLGMIKQAIQTYTVGLNSDSSLSCYQKRGMCYFETGNLQKALADFQKCSEIDRGFTEANFYKGVIYYKLKKYNQAILYLEECLKHDTDSKHLTSAVQTMMKIKIQDKDFYEAYHILNRTQNIDIDTQVIDEWRIFLQASLFLMKKKAKEGIQNYKSLLNKTLFKNKYAQIVSTQQRQRYAFIKPLVHLYKGFGQLNSGNTSQAKKQYALYDQVCNQMKISSYNLSKQYNSLIIQASQQFPWHSKQYLEKANEILKIKPQPYLYLVFDRISNWNKKQNDKLLLTSQALHQMINLLNEGIQLLPQLSNNHVSSFFYFRTVLFLYMNQFNKAVSDIDKAIEKSEDNIPKYFYLRGLIFACFGNFSQAIQDLSVAISLDEKYAKPYLERAKCLQIQGNSNEAFLDLQKYITLSPEDQNIHKYAGFLLFQNCAYEDCLSAFTHGPQDSDPDIVLTRAKCNFLLGDYQKAIKLLQKYQNMLQNLDYDLDIQMIRISMKIGEQSIDGKKLLEMKAFIKDIFNDQLNNSGKFFKSRDIYQLLASINLLLQQPEQALDNLTNSLELFQSEKQKQLQKNFVEDLNDFEEQWSEIEIKFNIALCFLMMKAPEKAKMILNQFQESSEKGNNWILLVNLVDKLIAKQQILKNQFSCFEQSHRLSKKWPTIKIPNSQVRLNMAFSYPFVQPPQMIPQFDHNIFKQFDMRKCQNKPQAPWINRGDKGLIFTPNIQVFDQLDLSMTTQKKNQQNEFQQSQNKPISQIDKSLSNSQANVYLQGEDLKKRFKLDSDIQIKLKKLMKKRQEN